ncbi:MAG TPA: serine/threonine-protein kinase [Kofleriaceae bacterium]|nr:serine/threonine-protein kinase [Kofleriaceae bacterium]
MKCPSCQNDVLDIDVKCPHCGTALGATGAHRMIGSLILGTYELVDVLGQGGMSVVFKARHKMTDQEVALKILPPELAAHSQVKSRFLDEAKALAALDHPNIVHLYNFGQENGSFVLAMQFVQGRTWERLILENKRLDWKASCKITIDVLKALEYAHGRGVVHRDMKPSNVLVRESDGAATVMDFGIAKMAQSTRLTATGQTMGTVRYMSPEQVRGQEVDLRTDIYSLGATLYESLVGDTPFDGSTHFEIMTKHLSEIAKPPSVVGIEVPRAVEDALMRCLAKKAPDRFDSARDMRKVLEGALKEADVALVETQRFSRDLIDVRATKDERPPVRAAVAVAETVRAATANDLADELEPGTTGLPARKKRGSKWPVIAVAVLVLGGGATAAALLMGDNKPAGFKAATKIKGLTEGKTFPDGLVVETDGKVSAGEVEAAYRLVLEQLKGFEPDVQARRDVIQEIVALPQATLCEPRAAITPASTQPCTESDGFTTTLRGEKRQLLIADDRGTLAQTMRLGVARAVCDFQFLYLNSNNEDDVKRLDTICEMTKRFGTAK